MPSFFGSRITADVLIVVGMVVVAIVTWVAFRGK